MYICVDEQWTMNNERWTMNNEQDLKKRTIKTLDQDRNVKGTEGSIIVCSNEGEGIK